MKNSVIVHRASTPRRGAHGEDGGGDNLILQTSPTVISMAAFVAVNGYELLSWDRSLWHPSSGRAPRACGNWRSFGGLDGGIRTPEPYRSSGFFPWE